MQWSIFVQKKKTELICESYTSDNRWILIQELQIVISSKTTTWQIDAKGHFSQTFKIYIWKNKHNEKKCADSYNRQMLKKKTNK